MNTCESTINRFLELNKNEHIPFELIIHLLCCKKCRSTIRLYTIVEKTLAKSLQEQHPLTSTNLTAIMKTIDPAFTIRENYAVSQISMTRWIVSGFFLIAGIILFGIFSTQLHLQVPLYLCFALFICCYCAFFVGSNLDFFIKKIDKTMFIFQ